MSEKPIWLDETEFETIKGLNWIENLEWRANGEFSRIVNEEIESILFHNENLKWGVGIGLKTKSGKCLWVYDAGDIISAKVELTANND